MRKSVFDDGFQSYLVEGATFVGDPGIPMMMNLHNTQVPQDIVPFSRIKTSKSKRAYIHFYMHDKQFSRALTATTMYLDLLKQFDGVITPDCSIAIGQSPCLQQANTYMNRAVGFYLQKQGIPVIPNIRWGDESTYNFCFLGVPKNSIICISTHGCLKDKKLREIFKAGLPVMLDQLLPQVVLVHGFMPDDVFGEYSDKVAFIRYPSEFERTHKKKEGRKHGTGL